MLRRHVLAAMTVWVLAAFAPGAAWAQSGVMRIAAVVNDEIISVLDLEQRLRLVALSSNLRLDDQTRQRLLPQVLRGMIDERLQIQEASDNGVNATDREIDREVQNLAERNNIPPVQFPAFLASQGVDIQTLRAQISAQIVWVKYATRRLSRQVDVGEEEIDEELERLRQVADKPQKRVYEIFLASDGPEQARESRQNTERLLSQIRGGADFAALARSFSESGSASTGGDLGWISPGQLPPALDDVLSGLAPGTVSAPIQTLTGYYLLYVTDVRTLGRDPSNARLDLFQMTRRLPAQGQDQAKADAIGLFDAARASIRSCEDLKRLADGLADTNIASAKDIRLGDLPPAVQRAVAPLQPGQTTQAVDTGPSVVMITICARTDPGLTLPSREQIQERLGTQRLDLLVRRKMRDLRRDAFIDIRL